MLDFSADNIFLSCRAASKNSALQLIADSLQQSGYVKPGFYQALVAREKSVSTYIGAGVAMPHCAKESIDLVVNTGFQIFQFPAGVSWGQGKVAFIVVAVAAREHEHIDVLSQLADLLGDELKTTLLARATSADEFIKQFKQS